MHLDQAERAAIVDRMLADPPVVHPMDRSDDPVMGVWSTDASCYRFIASVCDAGTRTLETGSGLSTTLFAALGAEHRCVTPGVGEVERLRDYLDTRGISADHVTFDIDASHIALPRLQGELDLVLIDGGHGFPMPMIDWFYAGSLLRAGGVLVIDDLPLPAVLRLVEFIDGDPRWESIQRTEKWAAYRRLSSGTLSEDWLEQPFFWVHPRGARALLRRGVNKAKREMGKLGRR